MAASVSNPFRSRYSRRTPKACTTPPAKPKWEEGEKGRDSSFHIAEEGRRGPQRDEGNDEERRSEEILELLTRKTDYRNALAGTSLPTPDTLCSFGLRCRVPEHFRSREFDRVLNYPVDSTCVLYVVVCIRSTIAPVYPFQGCMRIDVSYEYITSMYSR